MRQTTVDPAWRNLIAQHWLAVANIGAAVFVTLPLLAPVLMWAGMTGPAESIYAAYQLVCHQWAMRSFFLFGPQATYSADQLLALVGPTGPYTHIGSSDLGYKIAFCERDTAIYLAVLLTGLVFAGLRTRARPISLAVYAILLLPIALDGFTQLFGWRESTPLLRVVTGALFGAASVWVIYPRIDMLLSGARPLGRAAVVAA